MRSVNIRLYPETDQAVEDMRRLTGLTMVKQMQALVNAWAMLEDGQRDKAIALSVPPDEDDTSAQRPIWEATSEQIANILAVTHLERPRQMAAFVEGWQMLRRAQQRDAIAAIGWATNVAAARSASQATESETENWQ